MVGPLAVFISLIKFSKIVFAVWNFERSLKFYYWNNFCPSLPASKINWIGLFYFKLNSRKWENLLCVDQRDSPKYSNDQRGNLDWNWLKFYGERNTGLLAITTPSYKQPNKLSQLQNTHWIEFTHSDFRCHFKVYRDKLVLTVDGWRQKIDDDP